MTEAYEMYKDNMEVVALNPYDSADVASKHPAFADSPFITALSKGSWFNAFGTGAYPTTVLIDRYGVVCEIIGGAYDSVEKFSSRFSTYIGESYTQVLHP